MTFVSTSLNGESEEGVVRLMHVCAGGVQGYQHSFPSSSLSRCPFLSWCFLPLLLPIWIGRPSGPGSGQGTLSAYDLG